VRANITRGSIDDIISALEKESYIVDRDDVLPFCLHISGKPIVNSRAFKDGLVSIQDKSSMFVAEILAPVEGENILDACSAPGGKACQTAELLKGSGHVDATDIHEHKIDLIEHNIRKLRLKNVTAFQH
ncbi:16S rRNA (cytosine(967)-C(5))-methyltransferase RsmB, partial [Staphylococcus arlettae]